MEREYSEVPIPAARTFLIVRQHLVNEIAVDPEIRTARSTFVPDSTQGKVTVSIEYEADIAVLFKEFAPQPLSVVVVENAELVHTAVVASCDSRIVVIDMCVGYDNNFCARIRLQDRIRPIQRRITREQLKHKDQVLLAIDRDDRVEVLITSSGILTLVPRVVRVPEWPKVLVVHRCCATAGVVSVVVVIADSYYVWNACSIQGTNSGIRILPFQCRAR